jgi:hypothetical protein
MPGNFNIVANSITRVEDMMHLGLSTVPYTVTAVPYVSRIDEFESPRRYGTVITTAGIWVKMAVRDKVAQKIIFCN